MILHIVDELFAVLDESERLLREIDELTKHKQQKVNYRSECRVSLCEENEDTLNKQTYKQTAFYKQMTGNCFNLLGDRISH